MKSLRTEKPTDNKGAMKMNCKRILLAAALLSSVAISTLASAQPEEPDYVTHYIIVKVHPGVAPMPVSGVGMGFRYITEHEFPAEAVQVAEVLMAVTLQICGATSIEPMIRFPFANPDLAAQTGIDRFYTIRVPEGSDVASMVEQLTPFDMHLESATRDSYGKFDGAPPNDTLFTEQWYLNNTGQDLHTECNQFPQACFCVPGTPPGVAGADIDAQAAWTLETGSPDIITAVIDSGADLDHPDLINQLVPGQNFVEGEDPNDEEEAGEISHGTGTAGLIVAVANNMEGVVGICWGSKVMPLRIGGITPEITAVSIAEAIVWATNAFGEGVRIINMSFSNPSPTWPLILDIFIDTAHQTGLVMVASAGNTGAAGVGYPASHDSVIAVSATDAHDNLACFSTFGVQLGDVSVAAPGQDIVLVKRPDAEIIFPCPGASYCRVNGTSFSAPLTAGVAALILSANDTLTNVQVRQIIEDTADDLGEIGEDLLFGHGRINAYVAVCTARDMLCRGDTNGDCIVNTMDLLELFASWGGHGPGDLDCNKVTDTVDLLLLFANWGLCECATSGAGEPLTLEEELADACLTMADWDEYVAVMTDPASSQEDKDRYKCWMEHYLNDCNKCTCLGPVPCPAPDPFS